MISDVFFFPFFFFLQCWMRKNPPRDVSNKLVGDLSAFSFVSHPFFFCLLLSLRSAVMLSQHHRVSFFIYFSSSNALQPIPARFPSGMKALGDYMHARNVQYALYTAESYTTCAGEVVKENENEKKRKKKSVHSFICM